MNKLIRLILLLLITTFSASTLAFRFVYEESFTDPDFIDYKISKIALVFDGASFDTRKAINKNLKSSLKKQGVEIVLNKELFPPTRVWTTESRREMYLKHNVDSVLIITPGANSSSVVPMLLGSITNGEVSVYGNSTSYSQTTAYQRTFKAKSRAEFNAVLIDATNDRIAWYCDVLVKAGGALFVSVKSNAKGVVKGIVRALNNDSHITK